MINEKKLIEDLKEKIAPERFGERCNAMDVINGVLQVIDEQPKTDWIPCEERLPSDGEQVLVWFEYFRYGDYNRLFQTTGISYTWDGKWTGFVNGSSGWSQLKIIAWQPLPQPYKKEGAE